MSVVNIRSYRLNNEDTNWESCRENLRSYCKELLLRIEKGEIVALFGIEIATNSRGFSTQEVNINELEIHHMIGILELAKDHLKENFSG